MILVEIFRARVALQWNRSIPCDQPGCNDSAEQRNTRFRRAGCGVSQPSHHFLSLESDGIRFDEIDSGTPSMARGTRAIPKTNC